MIKLSTFFLIIGLPIILGATILDYYILGFNSFEGYLYICIWEYLILMIGIYAGEITTKFLYKLNEEKTL